MSKDRITIRFSNPRELKELKKMAEKEGIKLNRLVCNILRASIEDSQEVLINYLEDIKELK